MGHCPTDLDKQGHERLPDYSEVGTSWDHPGAPTSIRRRAEEEDLWGPFIASDDIHRCSLVVTGGFVLAGILCWYGTH